MSSEEDVPRFSLRRGARFLETFREDANTEDADEGWLADLGDDGGGGQEGLAEATDPHLADAPGGEPPPSTDTAPPDEIALMPEAVPLLEVEHDPSLDPGAGAQPGPPQSVAQSMAQPAPTPGTTAEDPTALPRASAAGPSAPEQSRLAEPVPGLNDAVATLSERLAALEESLARAAAACTVARMVLGHGQAALDHRSNAVHGAPPEPQPGVVDLRERVPPAGQGPSS